jgi:hypothetical protein
MSGLSALESHLRSVMPKLSGPWVKSIWLDLVRYSEALAGLNEQAVTRTETLFFLPDDQGEKISEVVCVSSATLIEFLGLSDESVAQTVLAIKEKVPHSLNAQANMTWRDVRRLQRFAIKRLAVEPPYVLDDLNNNSGP